MSKDDWFKSKVNTTISPSVLSNNTNTHIYIRTVISEPIFILAYSALSLALCLLSIVEMVLNAVFFNDCIHQYKLSVIWNTAGLRSMQGV